MYPHIIIHSGGPLRKRYFYVIISGKNGFHDIYRFMEKTPLPSPIGVFDSGFGGLHILRSITKSLPEYDFIYLGDTARTPYGTRSKDVIYEFTLQCIKFLFRQGCKLVIVACNTASSDALRRIQQELLVGPNRNKRVLGVLIPAAESAVEMTRNDRVGIIATEGTVASGSFKREIGKLNRSVRVYQRACPLLVPLVESGEETSEAAHLILQTYLEPFIKKTDIDTLVLGCTHYGILERSIKRVVGPNIRLVSEARIVPNKLREYLLKHPEIERRLGRNGSVRFFSTDLSQRFEQLGSRFFGSKISVEKTVLP